MIFPLAVSSQNDVYSLICYNNQLPVAYYMQVHAYGAWIKKY